MISEPESALPDKLRQATRARFYDGNGPAPSGKRRHRPPVIGDECQPAALSELQVALRVRADSSSVALMTWPVLWCEVSIGEDPVAMLGLLPGWLRHDPYGDKRLADPDALTDWLRRWIPAAAARWAPRHDVE